MKKNFILGTLFIIVASILAGFTPLIAGKVIDSNPNILKIDNRILLVLMFLSQTIFVTLGNFFFIDTAEKKVFEIRKNVINKILKGKMLEIDKIKLNKLPSHLNNNIMVINEFFATSIPKLISALFILIISIYNLFILNVSLSIVLICLLPIVAIVIVPVSMLSAKYSNNFQKEYSSYIEKLINIFSNIPYVKIINAEKEVENNLENHNKKIKKYSTENNRVEAFAQPFLTVLLIAILSVIFIFGGEKVASGQITIGALIAYLIYVFQLLPPVTGISGFFSSLAKYKSNIKEFDEYLNISAESLENSDNKIDLKEIERIDFKGVTFSYLDDKKVLNGIDLSFYKGEKIAIVGDSGSGKSTVYKLLLGLYKPTNGTIEFNGKEINLINIKQIRNKIRMIPQDNGIVYDKFWEFINLGKNGVDKNELQYYIDEFSLSEIIDIENDTDIGVGGKNLSSGERQRLLIINALMFDSEFILMDESTSNLDSSLESSVFENILRLKDKTIISITHRLSTVKYADRVIFFENGKITGNDNHENLYKNHPRYKQFIELQNISKN